MTARPHTYNIRATAQIRTNRTTHERERPSDERRHGYNGASKQSTPSRQNRKPPPPSVSGGWRGTTRGKQARGTRQGGKKSERETIAHRNSTASVRLPAHRVARRGERRRTDLTDGMMNEARDKTRWRVSRTSQHAPHGRDENAIAPAAETTGKQTEGTSQEDTA